MRLLSILLLAACLQEPNVSQEASDASQGYVIRYSGDHLCVVKGISNVECLSTTFIYGTIGYRPVKKLPINVMRDKESNLLSFSSADLYFSFEDGKSKFRHCHAGRRPWLRNMPFTISAADVTCHAIDTEEVREEGKKFSNICQLGTQLRYDEYRYNKHTYTYTHGECKLQLQVDPDAITYLVSTKLSYPEIMQCSLNADSLIKFKLSSGDFFTISCTDTGIEFWEGQSKVEAKMAEDETYKPFNNIYEIDMLGKEGELHVTASLPSSNGMPFEGYPNLTVHGHEARTIIYNVQGVPGPIKKHVE